MAVVDGRTLLDNANAVTNWGTFPADATAPNSDGDTVKFGSASVAFTADDTGGGEGICYDNGGGRDYTGEVLYMWMNLANPDLMETKADGGIKIRAAGTTISNFVERYIDGSDTYSGGWKMMVVDMDDLVANPDATGGTPPADATSLQFVGIVVDLITGAMPKMQDNLFIDASWVLAKGTPGIRVENGTFDWADVVAAGDEFDTTKAWGHVFEESGDIRLSSSIEFGDAASTSTTTFLDTAGRNIKFVEPNNKLPDDLFAVTFVGNGTGTTDIDFGAVVGTGDSRQGIGGTNWDSEGPAYTMDGETDIADLDTLNFYGGSINRSGACSFSGSTKTDLIGVTFNECGEIQPNDAECLNNFLIAPSNRGIEMLTTHTMKNITCVAGSNVNEVATFGTRTNNDDGTPTAPETFTHTVATGQVDVALLVMVGFEHTSDTLNGVTYGEVGTPASVLTFSLEQIGTVSNGTTLTVEAWILYDPPENVAHTISLQFSAAPDNVGVSCYNLEGVNRFSELAVFSGTASAATAISTDATDQSTSSYTVDMVYVDVSGPGTTFDATGGDATETRDVAVSTEAAYATSEDTAGVGDRTHDWTWTGSANAAQLVVSVPSIGLEHAIHFPTASDYSITTDAINFFGFGAAGTPKWHGENSGLNADVTINPTNGSDPLGTEFENTNAGTVTVNPAAVTTTIHVTDEDGGDFENARVLLEADDAAGDLPFYENVTITSSGATATVTHTAHGFSSGEISVIRGANEPEYNSAFVVTVTGANSYTYTISGSPASPATGNRLSTGQDETSYDDSPATEGTFSGGTGHAVSDVITLLKSIAVTVDAVSSGVVTQFTVDSTDTLGGITAGDTLTQVSTTGSGLAFSLTPDTDNLTVNATGGLIDGLTNASGNVSIAKGFTVDQAVRGYVRKSTASPRYKSFPLSFTIDKDLNSTQNVMMIIDE